MATYSVFDIIGPRMTGPSSSHTAGACRLAHMARHIAGSDIQSVTFTLYGSFATTGRGHGTDKALVGGILVILADLLGRTLFAPSELPVGILMSLIGAPYFLILLVRRRSHAGT